MADMISKIPYENIKWSNVYLAAIPYTEPRPLKFFETCGSCESSNACETRTSNCGKLILKDHGFEPVVNAETGRFEAMEVLVAVPHKVRPAVVIQTNELNSDGSYHQVFVAPIQSLTTIKDQELLNRIKTHNDVPMFHYISGITKHDSVIVVADIKRLHKSLLLKENSKSISEDDMEIIGEKISELLEIRKIAACQDCENNCDNCSLKKQVDQGSTNTSTASA